MASYPKNKPDGKKRSPRKRPTLGLFAHYSGFPVWLGAVDEARQNDANLFCYFGYELGNPKQYYGQSNVIYDLVESDNLDGLVTWGGEGAAIHAFLNQAEVKQFFERYGPLPVVNCESAIEGIPTVITETYQAMQEAITHLIEVHHCRRIVFLRGPAGHPETEERCRAYADTLAKFGLPYDPQLVNPPGGFDPIDGIKAIATILDERGLRPKVDFDALAFTDHGIIIGALQELQSRGVQIPQDVAVAGFQDTEETRSCTPPLTTSPKPFYEEGRKATELLLARMAGEEVPAQVILSSHLIVRQSCGCLDPLVAGADLHLAAMTHAAPGVQSDEFLAQLLKALRAAAPTLETQFTSQLVDGFLSDLCEASSGTFLNTLRGILHQAALTEADVNIWQTAISVLRGQVLPGLADEAIRVRAETLWNQARLMIGETAQRIQANKSVQTAQQALFLRNIGASLITTFNIEHLMNALASGLPGLGIPSCYLALYENPQPYQYPQPAPEWSRLMLAYNEQGRIALEPGGRRFRSRQRVPAELLPQDRAYAYVIEPLHFRDQQLGFAIFEVGPRDGGMYEALAGQISSALQGALLVQQVEQRVMQLNAAAKVSSFTSSILNPDELIQQTVELVRERFNLYYVGLFLADSDYTGGGGAGSGHRWADLRAGTGQAGQEMIARGHKLEIGGASMIGWCIANRQSRIALDVGQDAVRFNNPLLPETRSELALPLNSRGQAIGALTIQSSQPSAFSQEDVLVLQTMADQLANAIENARLFEQTQQRAVELSKAREAADYARSMAEAAKEEIKAEKEAAENAREEAEKARKESEAANRTLAVQMWQTVGQAQLNERMRGEQDISTLGRNVIQQLCEYLNVPVGALYLREDKLLKLVGTCAYQRKNRVEQCEIGEGMVGEAALRQHNILLKVPEKYLAIMTSTLGDLPPQQVLFAPFVFDGETIGVIELGTLEEFAPAQMEFLNKALESVAIAFMTAQARRKVNELLMQTRQQAEELQAQEEELRATNEELEAQTESLRNSEAKLKQNQAALEAANADLEEKAHILQEQQAKVDQQNRDLERKAEELSTASKYKSEFLANMSHELRTPLNSMLILSGMLAKNDEGNLTPDQVESAQVIYSGGNDLLNLINEILDLAKVEAGKMEFHFAPMPWDHLTDRMHAQFDPISQRKELQFITSVADDLPGQIVTDEQRLAQIVKNLLSNSFKFTEKGSVSLTILRAAADLGFDPAQFCAVSVSDTGIGMTPEQQKVVFEAFTQADGSTSRQYGGTGLGLTITREMTHRLGGKVALSSEKGKGSTFTIYLPVKGISDQGTGDKVNEYHPVTQSPSHPAIPSPSHPVPSSQSAVRNQQPEIPAIPDDRDTLQPGDHLLLIVEDDPSFAKIVLDYAHKKGFKAIAAPDGEAALQLLQIHTPEAVVLDLGLPRMSGWDVLDRIKNNPDTRHIPIHIISAANEDLTAFQRGAIGFLTKPVSQEDLDDAFQRIEQLITSKIKSLLLVEDDDNLRKSVRKLLEGDDIAITEAATGQAACEKLTAQRFDCMILDLSLPDMTGFELLSCLHSDASLSKCPVIVYTGKELTPEENQELLKYADSVIVKGVRSPERLLDETALFLHRVIADLPEDKQLTIRKLHNPEAVLDGKQILLVDDDTRNAFALSKLLADKGMKMHIAPSGAKALEALDRIPKISLVLTDIMMPGMDGYELIRHIRQQTQFKSLPIIALTAKAMKGDREKCIEAGASDYLSKPIDPDRLFSMLRVWLSRE